MRRAPRGFKIYKGKDGKSVFLDDVTKDGDFESLDNDKLPEDVKDGQCADLKFIWHDDIKNFVLCVPREKS